MSDGIFYKWMLSWLKYEIPLISFSIFWLSGFVWLSSYLYMSVSSDLNEDNPFLIISPLVTLAAWQTMTPQLIWPANFFGLLKIFFSGHWTKKQRLSHYSFNVAILNLFHVLFKQKVLTFTYALDFHDEMGYLQRIYILIAIDDMGYMHRINNWWSIIILISAYYNKKY